MCELGWAFPGTSFMGDPTQQNQKGKKATVNFGPERAQSPSGHPGQID